MTKRLFLIAILFFGLGLGVQIGFLQDSEPVPTLVPPTLVPTTGSGADVALLSESGVARIQRDRRVRVGILFNAPPFGMLDIRGEVSGFDADLARSMAEVWDVELDFVQVTRQTAFDALHDGQVDMLIAAQVHRRELDSSFEFSQTYYVGSQAMMVRNEDRAVQLNDLAFRNVGVGVVLGEDGAEAVAAWMERVDYTIPVRAYLTLDQAYVALVNGEVDGVVDNLERLKRVTTQRDLVRFLDEPVVSEPYAVVMPRQDVNLRNLVNRTLQHLLASGRIEEIHHEHFPGESFPVDAFPVWANLGEDAPDLSQFALDVPYPALYVVPRVLSEGVVRVAGVTDIPGDAPESVRRLDAFNRAVMQQMVSRWGVAVEYIPNSAGNALELLASGQADLALGVTPDWNWANRVDFTAPYLLHGDRMMVEADSDITSFLNLRGRNWIAIANSEPEARDRAVAWAESVNVAVEFYYTREQDIAYSILVENNANVAFGDSLKLIPHVQANAEDFQLTERWYTRSYLTLAVPRNDIDFRLLVEYTLQELVRDGTLDGLLTPLMLPDEIPAFEVWPGSSDYLGLSLVSSASG